MQQRRTVIFKKEKVRMKKRGRRVIKGQRDPNFFYKREVDTQKTICYCFFWFVVTEKKNSETDP